MHERASISQALQERFEELRERRITQLTPEKFAEASAFVSQLREQLLNISLTDLKKDSAANLQMPDGWMESETDCFSALRALCVGEKLIGRTQNPPVGSFVNILEECKRDPLRRVHLLAERYACPLNFALPSERDVREHVLNRLMVQDRALIEKTSVAGVNGDDLLLKLNLVGVAAAVVPDLRFLDALNYYYELLPAASAPQAQRDWLLASYFGLYARALAIWF